MVSEFKDIINDQSGDIVFYTYQSSLSTNNYCTLSEDNPLAKSKTVKLINIPRDCIVLKFDKKIKKRKSKYEFPFLKEVANLLSICDFIIILFESQKIKVRIVNLKSDDTSGSDEQVKAGAILASFLISTYDRLNGYEISEVDFLSYLYTTSIRKRPTKPNISYGPRIIPVLLGCKIFELVEKRRRANTCLDLSNH